MHNCLILLHFGTKQVICPIRKNLYLLNLCCIFGILIENIRNINQAFFEKIIQMKDVIEIADSNITKRALAAALKELMEEMPFAKISIQDICEKCDMNRKSFYYHFKDKYDLVNWIFDTEYIAIASKTSYERRIDKIVDLCSYFYENRQFYSNALQIRGQNSFMEHFHEILCIVAVQRLEEVFEEEKIPDFYMHFLTDSLVCAIVRWITEKDPITPEQFANLLKTFVVGVSETVCKIVNEKK